MHIRFAAMIYQNRNPIWRRSAGIKVGHKIIERMCRNVECDRVESEAPNNANQQRSRIAPVKLASQFCRFRSTRSPVDVLSAIDGESLHIRSHRSIECT